MGSGDSGVSGGSSGERIDAGTRIVLRSWCGFWGTGGGVGDEHMDWWDAVATLSSLSFWLSLVPPDMSGSSELRLTKRARL